MIVVLPETEVVYLVGFLIVVDLVSLRVVVMTVGFSITVVLGTRVYVSMTDGTRPSLTMVLVTYIGG